MGLVAGLANIVVNPFPFDGLETCRRPNVGHTRH